jgi:hypothetical protein
MARTLSGKVVDLGTGNPVPGAGVVARPQGKSTKRIDSIPPYTDDSGRFSIPEVPEGWEVEATILGVKSPLVAAAENMTVPIDLSSTFELRLFPTKESGVSQECDSPITNQQYELTLRPPDGFEVQSVKWSSSSASVRPMKDRLSAYIESSVPGEADIDAEVSGNLPQTKTFTVSKRATLTFRAIPAAPVTRVALQRSSIRPTREEGLWTLIEANAKAISFPEYHEFINRVLCKHSKDHEQSKYPTFDHDSQRFQREKEELVAHFGVGAYELLRTATELFLLLNCRVATRREFPRGEFQDEESQRRGLTPSNLGDLAQKFLGNNAYLRHVIEAAFPDDRISHNSFCEGVLTRSEPVLIELIWSYWHEEGMLAQSVNAIARRFQNQRAEGPRDPLAHFELDPLRPLNNILWGYVQEEYKRLTVRRRSAEYDHQYGLCLYGKASPRTRTADSRSKFLESFHNLLHRCSQFFKEDNDTTVIADGFPLLNALREVHLVLAQGLHNQAGDMAWTARVEMLMQQWIMARRETRDFLQSRAMVPYTEAWMPQVDTMKTVQGWTDVGVNHFRDLGFYGEQILLSIRYGDWVDLNDEDTAKHWARRQRGKVQRYIDCYRSAVGVDLTNGDTVDHTVPAALLKRRLDAQVRAR